MRHGTLLSVSAAILALAAAPGAAQEDPAGDEAPVEVHSKSEKKVEYNFSYFVKTHGDARTATKKAAEPVKKGKGAKTTAEEPAPAARPAEPPKPTMAVEVKGGKLSVTRAQILVNRNVDLGVNMDVFDREVRLTEFVKMTRADVDVHFDTIDVVSTLGGLEPGEFTLVYFDVDGREAYSGKFMIK